MLNLNTNFWSAMIINILEFLNQLFIEPSKALLQLTAEYFSQANYSLISILGIFIAYLLFSQATKAACLLIKAAIQQVIQLYKEKKRRQLKEIRAKERRRAEERLAYDREFEELYKKYVNEI